MATSIPRGAQFSPGSDVTSTSRVDKRGRVTPGRAGATFTFDTQFYNNWSKDPKVLARFEELRSIMEAEALTRVPYRTGSLARSIRSRVVRNNREHIRVELSAGGRTAPYWAFVEYGTGRRGAGSRQPEPGLPPGYRHSGVGGQKAQPYLRPSILAVKRKVGRGRN